MENKNCSCFGNILKVIEVLQKNSNNICCTDNGCDRPFLGNFTTGFCYNTRPLTFYTCNGEIFTATLNDGTTSSIFRVDKVEDNCVTCLVLIPATTPTDLTPYQSSGEYITISLDCVCILQCLNDVIVENIC